MLVVNLAITINFAPYLAYQQTIVKL